MFMLSNAAAQWTTAWLVGYILHSTLMLVAVWCYVAWRKQAWHALDERLWKTAVLLPLATASVQMLLLGGGLWRLELVGELESPVAQAAATHNTHEAEIPTVEEVQSNDMAMPVAADVNADAAAFDATADHAEPEVSHAPRTHATGNAFGDAAKSDTPQNKSALAWALDVFGCVSVCAAAIALMLVVWRMWQLVRTGKRYAIADETTHEILIRLQSRVAIARRVRLLESEACAEPFSYGVVRWTIVLPCGLQDQMERDEIEALLAHELAHLSRGDGLWAWLGLVMTTVFFLQPLNRLAVRRWRRATEFQCDEWATRHGVSRVVMAKCLATIVAMRLSDPQRHVCAAGALSASVGDGHLASRVKHLVDDEYRISPRTSRRAVRVGACCMAVIALLCVVVTPGLQWRASAESASSEAAQSAEAIQARADAETLLEASVFETVEMRDVDRPLPSDVPLDIEAMRRRALIERDDASLNEAIVLLDRQIDDLDFELRMLRESVESHAWRQSETEAVASVARTMDQLDQRVERIRRQRDELAFLVRLLDRERSE